MAHEKFDVGGMTYASCQAHVEKAVSGVAGVSDVAVNLLSGSMVVDYDDSATSADAICRAVDRAGYSASPVDAGGAPAGSPAAASVARLDNPTKKLEATADAMRTRLVVSRRLRCVDAGLRPHAAMPSLPAASRTILPVLSPWPPAGARGDRMGFFV